VLLGELCGGRERDGRLGGEVVRHEDVAKEATSSHCDILSSGVLWAATAIERPPASPVSASTDSRRWADSRIPRDTNDLTDRSRGSSGPGVSPDSPRRRPHSVAYPRCPPFLANGADFCRATNLPGRLS